MQSEGGLDGKLRLTHTVPKTAPPPSPPHPDEICNTVSIQWKMPLEHKKGQFVFNETYKRRE